MDGKRVVVLPSRPSSLVSRASWRKLSLVNRESMFLPSSIRIPHCRPDSDGPLLDQLSHPYLHFQRWRGPLESFESNASGRGLFSVMPARSPYPRPRWPARRACEGDHWFNQSWRACIFPLEACETSSGGRGLPLRKAICSTGQRSGSSSDASPASFIRLFQRRKWRWRARFWPVHPRGGAHFAPPQAPVVTRESDRRRYLPLVYKAEHQKLTLSSPSSGRSAPTSLQRLPPSRLSTLASTLISLSSSVARAPTLRPMSR